MKTAISKSFSKSLIAAATIAAVATPMLARAESATVTGAGALNTSAKVDFRITVPKVLFLRVGTGGLYGAAANTTVDLIDFTVPVANVGDGTPVTATAGSGDLANGAAVAATAGSGDLGNGAVTALLRSNAGTVFVFL